MSDYPMLISNKLHSFRNFHLQISLITRFIMGNRVTEIIKRCNTPLFSQFITTFVDT